MTRDEYLDWWIDLPDDQAEVAEPVRTLVAHIEALQSRIDDLPEDARCCCAYDHPDDVCVVHHKPEEA
jgi:hypothetical protein